MIGPRPDGTTDDPAHRPPRKPDPMLARGRRCLGVQRALVYNHDGYTVVLVRDGHAAAMTLAGCGVVEFRRYRLHPGARDVLIDVFETQLVEPQEAAGMCLGGTFLDEEDPDAFAWFRGFDDHAGRVAALAAFYGGPVWAAHREVANATMVDSDDVLMLRATEPAHAPAAARERSSAGGTPSRERVLVGVYLHDGDPATDTWLSTEVHAELERALATPVATWRTDPTPNGFPRLPVRRDHAFLWAATFTDGATREGALRRLRGRDRWREHLAPELSRRTTDRRHLRLTPTVRSAHPRAGDPTGHSSREES